MHHARHSFADLAATLTGRPALDRHGSRWREDGQFELTGIVADAHRVAPDGILSVEADGQMWTAVLAGPQGPASDMLAEGAEVTLTGKRSANAEQMEMRAGAVEINGRRYVVDPALA
ncbi:hypothetical protein [Mangrovicoccus sp. HB161399]|uniref:hypothetical protein n=1 Tax=Mangrovicoccus sp. HB161399 TaxID=2720392 RepID=UPI001554B582|nr:hypothetical protein [Mangrovicoccus sp. HB161399]